MKTIRLSVSFLLLVLWTACATSGAQSATPAQASKDAGEALLPAQFVEDLGGGWISLRCRGQGADVQSALLQARLAGLYQTAAQRLATSPEEKARLEKKRSELFEQVERLVRQPRTGDRTGRSGVFQRMRSGDVISVGLIAEVDEAGTREWLTEQGVLDKLTAPAGGQLTLVMLASGPEGLRSIDLARPLLFDGMRHLPLAWLDLPIDKRGDHLANLKLAQAASADLLLEFSAEKKQQREAASFSVRLQLYDLSRGTLVASSVAQSADYFLGRPGSDNRALLEALRDAGAKLSPQLPAVIRAFARP